MKREGGQGKGLWDFRTDVEDARSGGGFSHPMRARSGSVERDPIDVDDDSDGVILVSSGYLGSPPRNGYAGPPRVSVAPVTLADFKKAVATMMREFFESDDPNEVQQALAEMASPHYHYEFVKRAITMSMDRKDKEREMVSRLLSFLYPGTLTTDHIGKGFERLFEVADDLEIDVPGAKTGVSQFLSRAVVDELLPPSFLSDPLVQGMGDVIVTQAMSRLSSSHGAARVSRVWGPGDGRPVQELKRSMDLLLQEFLLSRDLGEATRCVRELNVPHFHHELVKRAVTNAMDADEVACSAMSVPTPMGTSASKSMLASKPPISAIAATIVV